jgi:transcriptional regulator with XRE-family HTH domain
LYGEEGAMAEASRNQQGGSIHPGEWIKRRRKILGLSQADLGRLAGFHKSVICRWEKGKEVPRAGNLETIEAAFARLAAPVTGTNQQAALRDLCSAAERTLDGARCELAQLRWRASGSAAPLEEVEVETLWQRLSAVDPERRPALVREDATYWNATFCVRLCDESERVAARNAQEARKLAELARLVARKAAESEGAEAWRLRAFAEGYFANSLKVGNDLHAAEAAFVRARRFWKAGTGAADLLSEACLLDLEASLRWAQRRFAEALKLHDQALEVARPGEEGIVLLNKSATLEQMGDYERSLEALAQAEPRIDAKRQPRHLFALRYNQAMCLCRLERALEAQPLVDEVLQLAEALENDLDQLRTQGLAAMVLAGLGQTDPAVEGLELVCRGFQTRDLFYDYAFAGLDLALLYREQGRWAEIRGLAEEMVEIFERQGVHRETLAAVILFQEAAAKEAVSIELVRRLQEYLKLAQAQPGLRFQGSA